MKALVTGGGGFLGRRIAEQLLSRGDAVTGFARGEYPDVERAGARMIRGDVADKEALRAACSGMDIVFHVAANVGIWGAWDSFYASNVKGTANVIDACIHDNVDKLIYTSSPSVIADGRPHRGVDERRPYPTRYENAYSCTKAIGEQLVLDSNCADLLTTSLRPHAVYGPRDSQIIPRLLARARAGKLVQVGDGHNKIAMTFVDDAARAHLMAADSLTPDGPVAGSAYFVNQQEPVELWGFVGGLLDRLDLPPVERRISWPVARELGGATELVHRSLGLQGEPRLTRWLVDKLALDHYYDASRAKQDFGYASQVGIDEGLERTAEYFGR